MSKIYESPFSSRYASPEMLYNFSSENKFKTFRKLWVSLARAQQKLGINITDEQINELISMQDNLNLDTANAREKEVRHDVMAHIYAYGVQCPKAAGIIHLGATSAYVADNTDIIIMREGLNLISRKLAKCIKLLSEFALEYKSMPTLGFTHLQPAQLTTVGKRASLWINEFIMDLKELEYRISTLELLGSKGTTGTQASFLELFSGDKEKVKMLEALIAKDFNFKTCSAVSGQTYSRKIDSYVLSSLSGIAQSSAKFATDLRLLAHMKELEEPFEKNQIGSSAMPYKRNPMRCERICALARYVIIDTLNPAFTAYNQWFERTLDDSANKRIAIPEAFLGIDSILNIVINIASGIVVYPKVIEKNVLRELPFIASENIMMRATLNGGDRQELHEKIRVHSIEAGKLVKEQGLENDLIDRIVADESFNLSRSDILDVLKPINYIGLSDTQTCDFINNIVYPTIEKYSDVHCEISL